MADFESENDQMIERIEGASTIALIDADLLAGGTRHPNLVVMKLSGYCKSRGKDVCLLFGPDAYSRTDQYDLVLVSKVFTFSDTPEDLTNRENVIVGGTGFYSDGGGESSLCYRASISRLWNL